MSVGGVILTSGKGGASPNHEFRSMSTEGISLGVLLSGSVDVTFAGRQNESFGADDGFLLSCREPIEMVHSVQSAQEARIVFLNLANDAFADQLQRAAVPLSRTSAPWRMSSWRPANSILGVARQIDHCPYTGPLRELYLQGKALELLSMVLGATSGTGLPVDQRTSSKTERLVEARAILLAELKSPPTLDVLARRVGLCTTALTAGFRAAFAMSVTEFVQEERLKVAYDALRAGEMTVSQAAFSVGLSPAYFSTLFRRRYGVPPSCIALR